MFADRRTHRREKGSVLVTVAVSMFVLIGMAALSVDLGMMYLAAQQLQNAADAAALAGACELRQGMVNQPGLPPALDVEAATRAALNVAAANKVLKTPVEISADDVSVGAWNPVTKRIETWDETKGALAVEVTARRSEGSPGGPISLFFARALGFDSCQVTRSATAGLDIVPRPRTPVNFVIVQDASYSFGAQFRTAVAADRDVTVLVNKVSVPGDRAGFVAFSGPYWPQQNTANQMVSYYIKHTCDPNGFLRKVDYDGDPWQYGVVREVSIGLTDLNRSTGDVLPGYLRPGYEIARKDNAYGDTATGEGLMWAIGQLTGPYSNPNSSKVIILVSDGLPHDLRGSVFTQQRIAAAQNAASTAQSLGIKLHTITIDALRGSNYEFNRDLVRNGGFALRAPTVSDVGNLLVAALQPDFGAPQLLK